jgi:predicted MFS family arabinose efflux permease
VLLSGVLTDVFGWQANFYIAVPLAVAAIVAAYVVIPADPPRATVAGPLVSTRIFAIRDVTVANVAMTLLGAAWVSLFYFLPLYQQQVLGYSPMKSGLTQLPLAIMIMVGSALAPRLPLRASLAIGLALLATGLAWFGQEPVDLIVPSLLTGAGLGIAFVHLTTLASRGVPAADTGLASGLINTTRQVGGAIGLAALTGLTTASAFIATAAIAAVAALFVSKGVQ